MLDQGTAVAVCMFLFAQTSGAIYFGGSVSRAVREHDRRLDDVERQTREAQLGLANLQGKENA